MVELDTDLYSKDWNYWLCGFCDKSTRGYVTLSRRFAYLLATDLPAKNVSFFSQHVYENVKNLRMRGQGSVACSCAAWPRCWCWVCCGATSEQLQLPPPHQESGCCCSLHINNRVIDQYILKLNQSNTIQHERWKICGEGGKEGGRTCISYEFSVADPGHFGTDLDPRIRKVPLTNGSGSRSGYFRQWLSRRQLFEGTFTSFFNDKKS